MNVYNNSWKYSYCFRMTEYILKLKSLQCFFFFFLLLYYLILDSLTMDSRFLILHHKYLFLILKYKNNNCINNYIFVFFIYFQAFGKTKYIF